MVTKSGKAQTTEPNLEWPVASHEDIDSQIKLLATYQERLVDIAADDIGLLHHLLLERHLAIVGPLLYLLQFVYKENS